MKMGKIEEIEEWCLVTKMRAIVEAQDPSAKEADKFTLRRFLRARDMDIAKSSSLFLKYLKWRRQAVPNGFISESEIQIELSQRKVCLQGIDKTGRPILIAFAAKHDYSKRQMDELKRFVIYYIEKACARTSSEKFVFIADFQGWGYSHCDTRAYIAGLEILQRDLEELFFSMYPPMFTRAWKIIYPFIDKKTREKIVFVDKKYMQETLLAEIDKSQLPDVYGGELPLVF